MDVERIINDIEQLQEMFEAPDVRPLSPSDISAANRRHDETLAHSPWFRLWQRYGVCAARESVTAHTILSVATSERTRGTVSKSTGGGTRGTRPQYQKYSMSGRSYKTTRHPSGVTSRILDIVCEGRRDRRSCRERVRGRARWSCQPSSIL